MLLTLMDWALPLPTGAPYLSATSAQVHEPDSHAVRCRIEPPRARDDGQSWRFDDRHALPGQLPRRVAGIQTHHAEVGRRVDVTGEVVQRDVGDREVGQVVAPIRPSGGVGAWSVGHFED